MKIVESRVSFATRAQEDYQREVEKVLASASGSGSVGIAKLASNVVRVLRVAHSRLKNVEDWLKEREEADAKARNRFADCETVSEVIAQAVGAGSAAWVGGTGQAVFDSEEATAISVEATERIRELSNP